MRQTKRGWRLSKRIVAALVAGVAFASPAPATIGIKNNSLSSYRATLQSNGWKVRTGKSLMEVRGFTLEKAVTPRTDPAEFEASVNQLIGEVLKTFAKEEADRVTLETRREVARIAREAIARGLTQRTTYLKTGTTGALRYRVGVVEYDTHYGPETGQSPEEWRRRGGNRYEERGLAPLIALMPRDRVKKVEAHIRVFNVPADAELFFDGQPTTQKEYERRFTTPALEVGKMYSYTILVRWKKDGEKHERSRTMSMSGGDDIEVNFYIYSGVANPIPKHSTDESILRVR